MKQLIRKVLIDLLEREGNMIFDNDYDKSLWLLVKADIDNKVKVTNFISSIPYELYIEIKDRLSKVNEYKSNNLYLDKVIYYHGNCVIDDRRFFYSINPYNYGLSLGYSVLNEYSDFERVYEFTIFPFEYSNLYDEKNSLLVARVEYDGSSLYCENTKDVFLSTGILESSYLKFLYQVSSWGEILGVKIINCKNLNDNIILNKSNKLIRKRKVD